jgi:hypothetical protein
MFTNYSNVYRIYIHSNKHPRTINTPRCGRTYYDVFEVEGKEQFIAKLNELVAAGEQISEVRYGWGGSYVCYWKYITKA